MSELRGAGGPGPAHPSPRRRREGGRPWAQLPVSGRGHSVSTVSVCPSLGLPFQARGRACLGDPSPPSPPSVSLSFAVCSRLSVLTLVLTVNVNGPILRVPPDTHTPGSTPLCATPASGRSTHCCCYQHQNKHRRSHSARLLSSLGPGSWAGHPGSGCRHMSHPLWQLNGSL